MEAVDLDEAFDAGALMLAELADIEVLRMRLEAEASAKILKFKALREREAASLEHGFRRELTVAGVADELSLVLLQSPQAVQGRIFDTEQIQDHLPNVWQAFRGGLFDGRKIRLIVQALDRLELPDSIAKLDERAAGYAASHTPGQLKAWLRRMVARLEPDRVVERHRRHMADRHVWFEHCDDNISWLHMMCSTTDAALMERELNLRAKASQGERTLAQARADVVVDALLGRTSETAGRGRFHIGVTVPLATLVGLDTAPAEAVDGSFALPAELARELTAHEGSLFSRLLTDESGAVLDVTEIGRFPSQKLGRAIELMDGSCIFPTCQKPAVDCDKDHERPYPAGATTGANLWSLCRRHHKLKTFNVFDTMVGDDGRHGWRLPSGHWVTSRGHLERAFTTGRYRAKLARSESSHFDVSLTA